jgi:hypothetical protein
MRWLCSTELVNGGFEWPRVPAADGFAFCPDASNAGDPSHVPGWRTTAKDQLIELWVSGHEGVTAYEGRQFVELNAHEVSTLYQDCVTQPGTTVQWGLSHRGRKGEDTMALEIGPPGATVEQQRFTDGNAGWTRYEGSYTVPQGQLITRFAVRSISAAGGDESIGNFLDAVYFGEKYVAPIELPTIFPEEEDIMPTRPPIDPKAVFAVIHQVYGCYLQTDDPGGPVLDQDVQIWHGGLAVYPRGRTWMFEPDPDGTSGSYLIRTAEPAAGGTEPLYLEATGEASYNVEDEVLPVKQKRRDPGNDRQSWLLRPVTGDINTYAFVSKRFPDFAIGTLHGLVGDVHLYLRPIYGSPAIHYYWRLSPPAKP